MEKVLEPGHFGAVGGWQHSHDGVAWAYDLELVIHAVTEGAEGVSATTSWTLRQGPPEYGKRLGSTAHEHCSGEYDPATRVLELRGHTLEDEHELIDKGTYRLTIAEDGQNMAGENVLEDGDRVPLELHRSWDAHTVARNKEVFAVPVGPLPEYTDVVFFARAATGTQPIEVAFNGVLMRGSVAPTVGQGVS